MWYDCYQPQEKAAQETYVEENKENVLFNVCSYGVWKALPEANRHLLGTKDGPTSGER